MFKNFESAFDVRKKDGGMDEKHFKVGVLRVVSGQLQPAHQNMVAFHWGM